MFFDGWNIIGRTLVIGPLAYLAMLLLLRVSGKRTLSKMNAFDFIVTVALGSTLASIIVSEGVALAEGVTAFALLIFAQYLITYLSVRSDRFQSFVKAEPTLLYHQDRFLHGTMRRERVTEEELRAATRQSGYLSLAQVRAVILETDGSFSVVGTADNNDPSAMANVNTPKEL